jgi:hypothetical protein
MEFEALIRGANFRPIEAQGIIMNAEEGTLVELVREPNNQYDSNAIMTLIDTVHVGYVAKEVAVELAPHMDDGVEFVATITARMNPKTPIITIVPVHE